MKKRFAVLCGTMLLAGALTACGGDTAETTAAATTAAETTAAAETEAVAETEVAAEITEPAEDVAMQYISIEDAKGDVGADGYTFFDVRKAADYEAGHIP